jgi:very-short-patch-repair endonuclease
MREIKPSTRKFARTLRKTMTSAEVLLWSRLRRRLLNGYRFHRQYPIGPYIADFVCVEQRLVVEVDGGTHSTEAEINADRERTVFLESKGWRVFRCSNGDVYENLNGTLDGILLTLERQI